MSENMDKMDVVKEIVKEALKDFEKLPPQPESVEIVETDTTEQPPVLPPEEELEIRRLSSLLKMKFTPLFEKTQAKMSPEKLESLRDLREQNYKELSLYFLNSLLRRLKRNKEITEANINRVIAIEQQIGVLMKDA